MENDEDNEVIHIHDDIDEDIKLLKTVLQDDDAKDEIESDGELQIIDQNDDEYVSLHSASRPSTSTDYTASSFPTTSMGTDADDLAYRIEHSSITPETCLAMNRAYQEVLLDTLRNIELSLTENRLKQKQMTDILEQKSKKPLKNTSKTHEFVLRTPFFIDKGDVPPYNADVTQKQQMGDDMVPVRHRTGWTKKVRKVLLKAIGEEALKHILRPILNRLEVESAKMKDCKNEEEIKEHTAKIAELKKELKKKQQASSEELLKNVDTNKIDFLKISCVEFDGRLSPGECEGFWRNVLHPSINREEWTEEEEQNLAQLAKKYNMKQWEKIADELGTNRTPFQCLQHYQLNSLVYDQSEWQPEEDELLCEVIDTVKYGTGRIQWSQVSYYIESRSASQCLNRWRRINPNAKRGRWANKEDCLLISAVEKYGVSDWARIANQVPGRSSIQCRDRYINCIAQGKLQWTYEEDKKLLQLYHQYKSFAAVSLYLEKRTEADVEKRYLQLKTWEEEWNQFCTLDREEQESEMSCNFKLTKDGTLVAYDYLKDWAEQEKALGKPKVVVDAEWRELYKFFEDHEYLRGMERDHWKWTESNYQIKTVDYFKQEQDRIQNEIIVPRPPPIRNQAVYARYLEEKEKLRNMIQNHVDSTVRKFYTQENKNNQTLIDSMSLTMRELFEENEKRKYVEEKTMEIIRKGGRKLFTHKLTVRNILDILRDNSPVKRSKNKYKSDDNKKKLSNIKNAKKEIWEESSEDDVSGHESEDSEDDDDDEDEFVEEEPIIKPKRSFTPAEIERYKKLQEAKRNHKYAMDMIREVIISKLPSQTVGRKRTFNMYPQNIRDKCKRLGEEDLQNEKHKCLALLMRSFDVDTKKVFKNAKEAKRKHAANALLMSAIPLGKTRRSKNKSLQGVNSEVMESADTLLDIQKHFEDENGDEDEDKEDGKQDIKVEPDVAGSDKHGANDTGVDNNTDVKPNTNLFESYDACLPYIPPNVTSIRGLKGFLLEHKCLVDKAGGYFDKDELRENLYKMKKRGPNLLMNVIGTVRGQVLDKIYIPRKPKLTEDQMKQTFKTIKQTKSYQQLKARFQAAFSWPALLATIAPPPTSSRVPDILLKIRGVVADLQSNHYEADNIQENDDIGTAKEEIVPETQHSSNTEKPPVETSGKSGPGSNKGINETSLEKEIIDASPDEEEEEEEELESVPSPEPKSEAELQREEDWNIDDSIKQVMLMTEGRLVSEEMEELEINMLVDKILRVFRERRTAKRKPKAIPGKYRKKMSEAMAAAVDLREKIKIMKRLNIYEKYKQIQEEKKELTEKMNVPEQADPNAPRRRGRPVGAKSMCYSAPDENTRRSSRQELLRAKAQQLEVYEECGASPKKRPHVAPKQFEDDYVYTRDEFKQCQKIAEKNRRAMEHANKDPKKLSLGKFVAKAKEANDVLYIKEEPLFDCTEQREVNGEQNLNQCNHSNGRDETQSSYGISTLEVFTQHDTAKMVSTSTNAESVPMKTNVSLGQTSTNGITASTSANSNTVSTALKRKLVSKATKNKMESTGTTTTRSTEEVYIATKQCSSGYTLVPVKSSTGRSTHYKLVPIDQVNHGKKRGNVKKKGSSTDTESYQSVENINETEKETQNKVGKSKGKKRPAVKTADEGQSKSKKRVIDGNFMSKTVTNDHVVDKLVSGKLTGEETVSENLVLDKTVTDNAVSEKTLLNKSVSEASNSVNQPIGTEKNARKKSGEKRRATKSPAESKVTKSRKTKEVSPDDALGQQPSNSNPSLSITPSTTPDKGQKGNSMEQIPETGRESSSINQTINLKPNQVTNSVQNEKNDQTETNIVISNDSVSQQTVYSKSEVTKQDMLRGKSTVAQCKEVDVLEIDNNPSMQSVKAGNQAKNSKSSKTNITQTGKQSKDSSPRSRNKKSETGSSKSSSVSKSPKGSSLTDNPKNSSIIDCSKDISKSDLVLKSPNTSSVSQKSSSITKNLQNNTVTMSGDAENQAANGSDRDKSQTKDPVMIGVPIIVGGVQQTAWLPIIQGKDGNLMRDKDGNIVIPKELAKIRYPGEEEKSS